MISNSPPDPATSPPALQDSRFVTALPWFVAALALVVLTVVFVTRQSPPAATSSAQPAPSAARPPDLASMSPSERASRLYVRVMQYAEEGFVDSVTMFMPMALAAHEMLDAPTVDERYHYGRVSEIVGRDAAVIAQADTILQTQPESLLGLVLATRGARMRQDEAAARTYERRLLAALDTEMASGNQDYEGHRLEIELAVSEARRH